MVSGKIQRITEAVNRRNASRLIELQAEHKRLIVQWNNAVKRHMCECGKANEGIEPMRGVLLRMATEAVINQKLP